jgi:ribosomal-protein-serine acetyltransferase
VNPILLDFPDHFETERLLIRAPRPGDGSAMNEAILESVESFKPWFPFVNPKPPSIEDSEEVVRRSAAKFILREDLHLLLFEKSSGRLIGSSGLHRIDWSVRRFEIGYWLRDSAVGKGYATEAVNGITAFADDYLGANRIEIRCDRRNERSQNVAERCGYHLEAILRNQGIDTSGQIKDILLYAKIRMGDGTLGYPGQSRGI